jgi:hypothetical protein
MARNLTPSPFSREERGIELRAVRRALDVAAHPSDNAAKKLRSGALAPLTLQSAIIGNTRR